MVTKFTKQKKGYPTKLLSILTDLGGIVSFRWPLRLFCILCDIWNSSMSYRWPFHLPWTLPLFPMFPCDPLMSSPIICVLQIRKPFASPPTPETLCILSYVFSFTSSFPYVRVTYLFGFIIPTFKKVGFEAHQPSMEDFFFLEGEVSNTYFYQHPWICILSHNG